MLQSFRQNRHFTTFDNIVLYACENAFRNHLRLFESFKECRMGEFLGTLFRIKSRIIYNIVNEFLISVDFNNDMCTYYRIYVSEICNHICIYLIQRACAKSNLELKHIDTDKHVAIFKDLRTSKYHNCLFTKHI